LTFSATFFSACLPAVTASAKVLVSLWPLVPFRPKWTLTWLTTLTDELGPHQDKEAQEWTFEFKGDKATSRKSQGSAGRPMAYTLDPSKTPKAIDLNDDGLVIEGIYKMDGDDLTLCLVTGSRNGKTAPRPPEFKADNEKKYSVFVLKRVKK
jgi:uncharacterized protein (TIGR03067 family)